MIAASRLPIRALGVARSMASMWNSHKASTLRLEDLSGDNQGAGLGLCQAAEVARAHGGNVELESTSGSGITVTLTVQLRPSMATTSDQQA